MLRPLDIGSLPSQAGEGVSSSLSDEGTKVEWFFDASRSSVRHKWAANRKVASPQLRDPDFLAGNAARGGVAVSLERQRLVDFENELDQIFIQLPKYALSALTVGGDMQVFNATTISELLAVLKERALEKRWSVVRIHGALLALRQLFDFKNERSDQMGDEGQATGAIVTRFLQDFKKESQQKAKKRKVYGEEEEEGKENQGLNIPVIPSYRVTDQQQTMVFSGQSKKNALHWAQAHFLVKLRMSDAFLSVGNGGEGSQTAAVTLNPLNRFRLSTSKS